jgi:hypothetical protein
MFPCNLDIEDVREAIKDRIDFMEIKNSDHYLFTYILMTEDSFTGPELVLWCFCWIINIKG